MRCWWRIRRRMFKRQHRLDQVPEEEEDADEGVECEVPVVVDREEGKIYIYIKIYYNQREINRERMREREGSMGVKPIVVWAVMPQH
mmetsp:Transcript_17251/g.29730  ORF Transcript_17251/g.29730 Transcript_17251/m.29730 type:complete len:87 (+) Transcript_17251:317-577(+)